MSNTLRMTLPAGTTTVLAAPRQFWLATLGAAGGVVRGHEFHYATILAAGQDEPLAELADAQGLPVGSDGGRRGHVSGTFFHAIARKEID